MTIESIEKLVGIAGAAATVLVETDPKVKMACVSVNGVPVMGGNDWDFYPGCHRGVTQELAARFGEWRGVSGLVSAIGKALPPEVRIEVEEKPYAYA